MTTNKKLVVTVGVMAVALILALTGIIVVLVSANQRASSAVNVKYTASDVYIRLSAKAYVGGANGTTYTFRNGDSDNLVLSPTFTEGSLSQVDDIIELSKSNPEVVFEYKFENMTEDIDAYIDLDTTLNESNIGLKYAYSAINQVTDFDTLSLNDTYDRQALCAGPTEDSRVLYIYIVVSINDLLYDAELAGTFDWNLGKSDAYRVDINDTNSGQTSSLFVLDSVQMLEEPDIQAKNDYRLNGWYTDESMLTPAYFPIELTNDISLYVDYQQGNLPADYYVYDEGSDSYYITGYLPADFADTTLVIPDYYNGKPVTAINITEANCGTDVQTHYGLVYMTNIESVYVGNNITSIYHLGSYFGSHNMNENTISGSEKLKFVELGRKTEFVDQYVFEMCYNLETLRFSDAIRRFNTPYNTFVGSQHHLHGTKFMQNNVLVQCYNNPDAYVLVNGQSVTSVSNLENWDKVVFAMPYSFVTLRELNLDINSDDYNGDFSWSEDGSSNLSGSVTIPSAMTEISDAMFAYTNITEVTMHYNVNVIGAYAFEGCDELLEASNADTGGINYYTLYCTEWDLYTDMYNVYDVELPYYPVQYILYETGQTNLYAPVAYGHTPYWVEQYCSYVWVAQYTND